LAGIEVENGCCVPQIALAVLHAAKLERSTNLMD